MNWRPDVGRRPQRPAPAAPEPRLLGADAGAGRAVLRRDPDRPAADDHQLGNVPTVQKVSAALELLPQQAQERGAGRHRRPTARRYALAVYLFAPLAVIVPMTISTAVGANTLVGEKEKGTGEFLAHSPGVGAGDLPGQAHRQPAARLPHDPGRLRDLLAGRQPHRRAPSGRLVLPHARTGGC